MCPLYTEKLYIFKPEQFQTSNLKCEAQCILKILFCISVEVLIYFASQKIN